MLFFEGDNGGGSGGAGGSCDGNSGGTLLADAGGQGGSGGGQGAGSGEAPKFLVGEDGAFTENWTTKLPEELGDYRNGLAKFKNVADFAKSYQGLEQKLGSKANLVAIPTDKSTPEEVGAYRKALGIPEKAEDYKLTPEKFPEGMTPWPKEIIAPFEAIAHKHNVPIAAMKEMIAENLRQSGLATQAQADAIKANLDAGRAQLQKEFGADYAKNIQLATAAAKTVGVDPSSPGFSDPAVVKGYAKLAQMLSDDKLVKGGGLDGGTTLAGPARAKDIQGNPENPQNAKYRAGDPDTVALVRRLLQE